MFYGLMPEIKKDGDGWMEINAATATATLIIITVQFLLNLLNTSE